jgi:GxxExxY protein
MALDRLVEQTGAIIGAAIEVQRQLGIGLLERIYQNALGLELSHVPGARVRVEHPYAVKYRGVVVGEHRIDLLVQLGGALVVVECKHFRGDESLPRVRAVVGSYLAIAGADVGLVLNFSVRPLGVQRVLPHYREACAGSA